jgi:hypothetical protein
MAVNTDLIQSLITLTLLILLISACSWLEKPTSNPELNEGLPSWCGGAMMLIVILIGIHDIRRERAAKRKRESRHDD